MISLYIQRVWGGQRYNSVSCCLTIRYRQREKIHFVSRDDKFSFSRIKFDDPKAHLNVGVWKTVDNTPLNVKRKMRASSLLEMVSKTLGMLF